MSISDKNCPDELVLALREGSADAFSELCEMYKPMLLATLNKLGLDRDEYFSDACLALYKSALTYDLEQDGVTFGLYAGICIRHRLVDLVRRESAAERRLSAFLDMDTIAVPGGIVSSLIRREERELLESAAERLLSDYEYRVFELWLSGESISVTADVLSSSSKSIENARARIMRKLRDGMRQGGND